jgi:Ca-activated chloride channel family protein
LILQQVCILWISDHLTEWKAAKKVMWSFVKERKCDRIGLAIFSGLAFTQCPLTTDKNPLTEFI